MADSMVEEDNKYIVIIGPDSYNICFEPWGTITNIQPNEIEKDKELLYYADLVVFTGGSDVDPNLYGERRHGNTNVNTKRDMQEAKAYALCNALGTPMAGICRGSQFLTVMNGGKLIQHVDHHALASTHEIRYISNEMKGPLVFEVEVTSTHHQMMYPWSMPMNEFNIIAYAKGLASKYEGLPEIEGKECMMERNENSFQMEPEVVWYPRSKCLCAQFHPEMMAPSTKGFKYYQDLIGSYLFYTDDGDKT